MLRHLLLAPSCLLTLTLSSPGQTIAPEILTKAEVVYPPIAKAAHVSGTVVLQITINTAGNVTNVKTVSGPPMLVGAAQDSVRKWTYKSVPATQTFPVSVDFTLPAPHNPNDEKIAKEYFSAFDACRTALRDASNPDASAAACAHTGEIASTFSDQERFIERRSAYVYAAGALLRNKKSSEALDYANKAVAVIKQGHDDGSGSNAAYSIRAQAEASQGDLAAADADLTIAETFERKAIDGLKADAPQLVQHEYYPTLKNELLFHARILDAEQKPEAALAKRTEAEKL